MPNSSHRTSLARGTKVIANPELTSAALDRLLWPEHSTEGIALKQRQF